MESLMYNNPTFYGYFPGYASAGVELSRHQNRFYGFSRQFPKRVSISFDTIEHDATADFRVLMQCESPTMYIALTPKILDNYQKFNLLLTYDERLLGLPNARLFVPVGNWVNPIPDPVKKPQITMLMSSKRMTHSHLFRFKAADTLQNLPVPKNMEFDFYRSPPRLPVKDVMLENAMFHVAMENQCIPNMFTEKLLDCFITKTVPVYYGCTNLARFFNANGVLQFYDAAQLANIYNSLSPELYQQMQPAVEENYLRAQEYTTKTVYERIEDLIEEYVG